MGVTLDMAKYISILFTTPNDLVSSAQMNLPTTYHHNYLLNSLFPPSQPQDAKLYGVCSWKKNGSFSKLLLFPWHRCQNPEKHMKNKIKIFSVDHTFGHYISSLEMITIQEYTSSYFSYPHNISPGYFIWITDALFLYFHCCQTFTHAEFLVVSAFFITSCCSAGVKQPCWLFFFEVSNTNYTRTHYR